VKSFTAGKEKSRSGEHQSKGKVHELKPLYSKEQRLLWNIQEP